MTRTTVDVRATLSYTGTIVKLLSASMSVPLVVALIYGEDALTFAVSMTIAVAVAPVVVKPLIDSNSAFTG